MRNHLLRTILIVCSGRVISGPAVIDDVVREAKVSRGTFYKYFNSLDEAIEEIGATLVDEMTLGIYPVYNVLDNPLQRAATGFLLFLCRAVIDPNWGGFVFHVGRLPNESVLLQHTAADVRLGVTSGDFKIASIEAAGDLILGLQSQAMRRIVDGEHNEAYVQVMTGILLRGLGTPAAKADQAVKDAYIRLCREAPKSIPWWKPIT